LKLKSAPGNSFPQRLKSTEPGKMAFETTATIASFGGKLLKLKHQAQSTNCEMALNLYLPPQASTQMTPVLFYLSGLTCTGDNCAEKGFLQHAASRLGIAVVYPDTSPRGLKIQGEDKDWDFGTGAGFYVDATKDPWTKGYNMYTYIVEELPKALFASFQQLDSGKVSITGHSMGGHGALTIVCPNMWVTSACTNQIKVPTQSRQIQIVFGFCSYSQSYQLPVGPEGVLGVFWRRE
jgi:S-formylglutathione hydrolase